MLDHDEYRQGMEDVAREEGWDDMVPFPTQTVEEYRLTGMSPWEAVAILA